ncbi:MAG: M23 family metallopeptidase [bacterium]
MNQRIVLLLAVGILIFGSSIAIIYNHVSKPHAHSSVTVIPSTNQTAKNQTIATNSADVTNPVPANTNKSSPTVVVPTQDFFSRVTKKPFGISITPATSPVQPERFSGYHTGADAETTVPEQSVDVPVYSIADGTVIAVEHVNGYGGLLAIQYFVQGEDLIAIYGHIRLSSATVKSGDAVTAGEQIAVLGTGFSTETDGEREHLHFGLISGTKLDVRGYVQNTSELSLWLDPVAWLKARGASA